MREWRELVDIRGGIGSFYPATARKEQQQAEGEGKNIEKEATTDFIRMSRGPEVNVACWTNV